MDKLKHLHVKLHAKFPDDCDNFKPNNLHPLSILSIRSSNAYGILASSRHLHGLKCLCPPQLPDFRFLTELESLKIVAHDTLRSLINYMEINFPLTIKKLSLSCTRLPWERMPVLGRLPKLQVLKLLWNSIEGKEWKTSDCNFHELKILNMEDIKIEQWIVSSEHFPRLEHLVLRKCEELMMIPTKLGDIPTLSIIEVQICVMKPAHLPAALNKNNATMEMKSLKSSSRVINGRQLKNSNGVRDLIAFMLTSLATVFFS